VTTQVGPTTQHRITVYANHFTVTKKQATSTGVAKYKMYFHSLQMKSSAWLTKTTLGAALGVGFLFSGSAQASLVLNGGFENGLADWTCTISNNAYCSTATVFGPAPEGSTYFFGYDNIAPGILSQTLPTVAGTTYDISFFYNSSNNAPANTLAVEVGSLTNILGMAPNTWTPYSGTFTAASSSTSLKFLFKTDESAGILALDNVVVNATGSSAAVPGPLPLLGAGAAFGWSRRLRKRISTPLITPPQA
jgi:MYXO-CTERM domain-containing protein